jgi:3-oxoacyl-[acyl-carrier protein] reductase
MPCRAVCLVTGASRGIGRSIALALGAAGARVSAAPPADTRAARWVHLLAANSHPSASLPRCRRRHRRQVAINYASSAGKAEEVAEQIRAAGGDAMVVRPSAAHARLLI